MACHLSPPTRVSTLSVLPHPRMLRRSDFPNSHLPRSAPIAFATTRSLTISSLFDDDDRWLHKYKVLTETAKERVEKAIQQTVDSEAQAGGAESHLREYGVREGKPGAVPLAFAAPSRPCARPAWAHTPAIIMMQSLITSNRRVPRSPSAP